MKVSVIVALYNARAYICEAVDSILKQTRPAHEILIVDDGSTDDGVAELARYGAAITVMQQANAGAPTAINRALRSATGDTIAFLDSDDLWAPEKLDRQVRLLDAKPALDGVFCFLQQFATSEAAKRLVVPTEPQPGISRTAFMVRRDAFARYGTFDESFRIADFVSWYTQAAARGLQTEMLPDVLAFRRIHGANVGVLRRNEQQQENLMALKRALDIKRQQKLDPKS